MPIKSNEVLLACATFLLAHPTCGEAFELALGHGTLRCWCALRDDLRAFEVVPSLPP
jgi:hypothetical protein